MRYLIIVLFFMSYTAQSGVTSWVDFELDKGHIKIPVSISGIKGHAILDSGAQINAINQVFVKKHDLKFDKGQKVRISGVYGTEKKPTYNNVPATIFGSPFELDNLVSTRMGHADNLLIMGAGFLNDL